MSGSSLAKRLESLPVVAVGGLVVPVALGLRARLLGLSHLDLDQAGAGLLIPRCSSVHTFGMRFALDLHFLDRGETIVVTHLGIGPRRLVSHRGAVAVLELPSIAGSGKFDA